MRTREEFLELRRQGIGGSDIACLVGQNPYKTAFELWHDKIQAQDKEVDPDAEERMYWGIELEKLIAERYAKEKGVRVQRVNKQLHHYRYPIAMANIDRAVVADGTRARWDDKQHKLIGCERLLEIKTANAFAQNSDDWGEPGTDEIPIHYWYQVQWYMGITDVHTCDLAVLFGGQKFRIYTINFEPEIFNELVVIADKWWNKHVLTRTAPSPNDETEAKLKWKKPKAGKEMIIDTDAMELVLALQGVNEKISRLEAEKKAIRDKLIPCLEDAEVITHAGEKIATYKANKDSVVTDWRSAYESLSPSPEHIYKYQTIKQGARVLRLC